VGRSVPAMAVTLLAFVVTRIGIAEIARGHYMAPLGVSTQDFTTLDTAAKPTAWWLDQAQYVDGSGHVLSDRQVADIGDQPSYFQAHGIHLVQHYQPGDRFWTFQTIEAAILFALAALVLGFAIYWVARRVT
jgi:hypothetical protein